MEKVGSDTGSPKGRKRGKKRNLAPKEGRQEPGMSSRRTSYTPVPMEEKGGEKGTD